MCWKRLIWLLGTMTGLLTAPDGSGPVPALGQENKYRSATSAPVGWQQFAAQVQSRFQQQLSADGAEVHKLQEYLQDHAAGPNAVSPTLVVRTWILPEGKIERVEFDGIDDGAVVAGLRALLARGEVDAPPPDMLQPLHLRLSLRPQPREGK
jgi:hypothetical protein